MKIGVVRETTPGERRVALVPETVARLAKSGNEVVVERSAGEASSFPDRMYTEAGAAIGDAWAAELVLKVARPSDDEIARLREGALLIAFLQPLAHHARATHGRALLAGDGRRLQGGAPRGRGAASFLPDADHGGGDDRAREGLRHRRGRGRAAGHRHRAAPGGRRRGVRHAARR